MLKEQKKFLIDKSCEKTLLKCKNEIGMPATYFTLDEIARKKQCAPISLSNVIEKLQKDGFQVSQTSLDPTGFRTNARIDKILQIF